MTAETDVTNPFTNFVDCLFGKELRHLLVTRDATLINPALWHSLTLSWLIFLLMTGKTAFAPHWWAVLQLQKLKLKQHSWNNTNSTLSFCLHVALHVTWRQNRCCTELARLYTSPVFFLFSLDPKWNWLFWYQSLVLIHPTVLSSFQKDTVNVTMLQACLLETFIDKWQLRV